VDRLVTIKSNRYGIEVHLDPQVSFDTLLESLFTKLKDSAKFFEGAKMAVSFLDRKLSDREEQIILDLIAETTGLDIVCIVDRDETNEMTYKSIVENTLTNISRREGQFYRGTLSRKQVLESDTSIIILGDVEFGAKVIAKGNVVIVGSLTGSVHAGASGDRGAFIAALSMQPKQLRIGDIEARRQAIHQESLMSGGPKVAVADGRRIYVDPLVD